VCKSVYACVREREWRGGGGGCRKRMRKERRVKTDPNESTRTLKTLNYKIKGGWLLRTY
jgi:hypothetical protein